MPGITNLVESLLFWRFLPYQGTYNCYFAKGHVLKLSSKHLHL